MRCAPYVLALLALTAGVASADPKPPTRFIPANPNYHATGRAGNRIRYVVIHTIEGSAGSGINTFRSGGRKVSAHYIVDKDGAITQMVRDQDTAWHAGRYNKQSIGIEHAGFADRNTWTMAQYRASAALTRWLCDTYDIPKTREHIVGHVEVPGATHHDPGRYFDWNLYMRLVRDAGDAPEVQLLRPLSGQTVGADHVRPDGTGLLVEWSARGDRPQASARVLVEEVGGALRYDSGSLTGTSTQHRLTAALKDGKTYRWRVRTWDGEQGAETPWTEFRTDFVGASIVAVSPKDGARVDSTPILRWRYQDPDGPQVSYRVWLDDDADHSKVLGDTKELNGAADSYFLAARLKPNTTYYWRAMGYDGHGNVVVTGWQRFTTASDFVDVVSAGLAVVALSPKDGAVVAEGERAVLRWAYHSGQRRDQRAFRLQIDEARDTDGRIMVDESYDSRARGYRARLLPRGSYRWRVKVWDGREAKATDWQTFSVGAPEGTGISEVIGR